jgi:cytoskeletal protein RodZ
MVESLGQYLGRARANKGVSLQEIAAVTRIGHSYLRELEADDFSNLPTQTVTKSYVRTYARFVGLDEAEVMRRFAESAGVYYRDLEAARTAKSKSNGPLKTRLDEFVSSLKLFF